MRRGILPYASILLIIVIFTSAGASIVATSLAGGDHVYAKEDRACSILHPQLCGCPNDVLCSMQRTIGSTTAISDRNTTSSTTSTSTTSTSSTSSTSTAQATVTHTTVTWTITSTVYPGIYPVVATLDYYRSCYGCSYFAVLGIYSKDGSGPCLGLCVYGTLTTNQTAFGSLDCNHEVSYEFIDYSTAQSIVFQLKFTNGTIIYSAGPTDRILGTWIPPCTAVTITTTSTSTLSP